MPIRKIKKKPKIVLFRPKPDRHDKFLQSTPVSLLCVSSFLAKEYDVRIVDAIMDADYEGTILDLCRGALLFGLSSMTGYQVYDGLKISKSVKEKYPNLTVVWGGWHPTIIPEQTVSNPNIDIVVRGLGEKTFYALVKALEKKKDLEKVPNITFKKDGKITSTRITPPPDINSFPRIPYELIDVEKYIYKTPFGNRTIDYRSSYGCPYSCNFCADRIMSFGRWNALSSERVLDEIQELIEKYNIDSIQFFENNFFLNPKRAQEICEGMIKRKFNIRWGNANGRTDQMKKFPPELWRLIKESGCHNFLIGAESGNNEVLKLLNKDATVQDTIDFIMLCKKYDIRPFISLMTNYPFAKFGISPKEELFGTLKLIKKLFSITNNLTVIISFYTPYPGTKLYDLSIEAGMKKINSLEEWANVEPTSSKTPGLSQKYTYIVDQLNDFIYPYNSCEYSINWKKGRNPFKRCMHYLLHLCAKFRMKHDFFYFPIEYFLLKRYVLKKAKKKRIDMEMREKGHNRKWKNQ